MTVIGAVTIAAILLCLKDWQRRFPWLLSATLVLPISAAVAVPGLTLTPYYLAALVLSILLAFAWVSGRLALVGWPGDIALFAFVGWSVLITAAGPALFNGIEVLNSTDASGGFVTLTTLQLTSSNVAQLAYLTISAAVICFLALRGHVSPHIFLPGLLGCMSLSTWRLLNDKLGVPFPVRLVDSGSYAYIDVNTPDAYRLRGVFTEPSTLAHYATAAFALSLVMLYSRGGRLRPLYLLLASLSAVNLVFARSGTALLGGATVMAVTAVLIVIRATRGRGLIPVVITLCGAAIVALVFRTTVLTYVSDVFSGKVGSGSYDERTFSDAFSLRLFLDTFGLGVGLGSNKPSSLWPMMLSCAGVVGTGLFVWFVLRVLLKALSAPEFLGAVLVVSSMLVTKSVAGSFLSEPLLMLGLGVCAHAAARGRRVAEGTVPEAEAVGSTQRPLLSRL